MPGTPNIIGALHLASFVNFMSFRKKGFTFWKGETFRATLKGFTFFKGETFKPLH
jgi:hypothetical protein